MSATTTHATRKVRRPQKRAAERVPAVLRDPTAPATREETPHRDDHSHTPPHGDALLPRRR
jgi:hypothetical protein